MAKTVGTSGDDTFTAPAGSSDFSGLGGTDTIKFNFRLVDATFTWLGNQVIVDTATSHTVLSGFEVYQFTDGTVNNADGNPLVDDLFYYAHYHDVWAAHIDADVHYNQVGWHEGRDPNAFFSTELYLGANPDVAAAGVNPLIHFDQLGWKEGRQPSENFDVGQYLTANPDVAASKVDPLAHFLLQGAGEGRQPFATGPITAADGFDYAYYLSHNPDVAASGADPLQHYLTVGWKEGRNPNAYFDTKGYLATYPDVAAAGVNPLEHFHSNGWQEGRDPSPFFDAALYLQNYPDVAAAHVDPLEHYLSHGIAEGRVAFQEPVRDADAVANALAEGASAGSQVGVTASWGGWISPNLTFALSGDTSSGGFKIDPLTGVVTVADSSKFDYETSGPSHSYTITVVASEFSFTQTQTFSIAITDVAPSSPADANSGANTVVEGAAVGTVVGVTASSSDVNGGAVTYSLIADSSGGGFTINSTTGVITVANSSKINYETPGNAYSVTVQASDGTLTSSQSFSIAVTDVAPTTPSDVNGAANTVAEGAAVGTAVGITASSADINGPAVTWSLTADSSAGGFAINSSTGAITVANSSKIDYESAAGHAYSVTATASDGTLSSSQTFSIAVTDVAPATPTDVNGAANSVAEGAANGSTVGVTAFAADPNGPAASYLLTDNAGGRFAIDSATGIVTVANGALIDYETAAGHAYGITVQAQAGALSSTQNFTIAVANVAPSSPTDSDAASETVSEGAALNTTVGITATSTDPNGPAVTWSIVSDDSLGGFKIGSSSGVVSVADPTKIDYETAPGVGHSYVVLVQASDGQGGNTTRPFTIVVNNVAPAVPQDTSGAVGGNVTEAAPAGATVGITASSTDPNGPVVAWSITNDTSGGGFKIDSNGVVSVADASKIDYETAPGLNHSYDITVQASDGQGGTSSQVFNILVANVNPATPTEVADGTPGGGVLEAAAVNTLVGITASSSDPNGPTPAWSITNDTSGGGFKIDSNGVVSVADPAKINYENAPGVNHSYDITVQASDGQGGTSSSVFNILVGNVAPGTPSDGDSTNDAAGIQGKIEEGGTGGPVGITAVSTDPNGPAVTWSILSGSASGAFQIHPTTGVVSVLNGALLNYETAPLIGAGPEHGHTILVQASDGQGGTSTQTFTIEVTNLAPAAPTDTDPVGDGAGTIKGVATFDATEGTLVGIHAQSAGDPAGGDVTYELAAGSSTFFQIDSGTGEVSVSALGVGSLVAGTDYDISVVAKDTTGLASGTSTATPFKIHVQSPAPAAPTDADTGTGNQIAEDAVGTHGNFVTSAYTGLQAQSATATSYSISTDTSGGGFQIDPTTGKVYVDNGALIDYESAPGHKYTVTVVASDGAQTSSSSFNIDVIDVAPTTPVDADASAGVLADPVQGRLAFNAANGSNVGITVNSSDIDGGALNYVLDSNPGGVFAINLTTGVVTLADNSSLVAGTPLTFSAHAVSVNGDSVSGTNVGASQTFTVDVVASQPVVDLDLDNSGGTGIDYATTFTEGGSAVAIADADVTITETGFTTLASATVKLTNAQLGDTLGSNASIQSALTALGISAITPNVTSGGGVITVTLTGSDTFAHYQAALHAVTFSNTLDTPNTAVARNVTVTVNDGTNPASNAATTTITVVATNDAPDLTPHSPAAALGYTENGAPSALLSSGAVTDADNPADFSGGGFTVAITGPQTGDQIVVLGSSGFSVSGSSLIYGGNPVGDIAFASGSATVTNLTTGATPTVVNALVKAFGYQSSSEDPVAGSRTIQFTFNDGGHTGAGSGVSNVVSQTINVTAVNDAPVALNGTASVTEDIAFSGQAAATDVDNTQPQLTYSLVGANGGALHGTVSMNNDGSYTYTPTSQFNGTDTFQFKATDLGPLDSNTGTIAVTVNAVNDAPVVHANASPASVAFTEGDPGVHLLSAGTITDPDNPANFAGGSFAVAVASAQPGDEIFVLGSSGFTVNGSSLDFGGHSIGTIAFVGATATVSALTAFATPTIVNSLAEAFAYRNASDSFETTDRTVSFTFHDGGNSGSGGDLANVVAVTQTITLTAVNDAPVNNVPAATQVTATDTDITFSPFNLVDNGISVSDVDAQGNSETVTLTVLNGTLDLSGTTGLSFTVGSGTGDATMTFSGGLGAINTALDGLVYHPGSGYSGTDSLTILTNDGGHTGGGALTDSDTVSILVTSPGTGNPSLDLDNVDATAVGNDYATTFTEAGPAVAIAGSVTIVDTAGPDTTDVISSATITLVNHQAGDTLAVQGSLPVGIVASAYDPVTGVLTLTGATTAADYQTALDQIEFSNSSGNPSTVDRTISVTVTDDTLTASNTAISTIHVTAVNTAPSLDLDSDGDHDPAATVTGYQTSYTENGTPVAIVDTDVTINDPDNTTLVSATATITNFSAGDLLSIAGVLPAGIHAAYAGGVLTLTSDTANTLLEYQTALQQIVYQTTSDTPETTDRSIDIKVNDGVSNSNVATATVSVTAFNDPPVNTVPAGPLAATEDTNFAITGLHVADPDIGLGDHIKVTLSVQHGTIHVLDNLGAGFLDPSDITGNDTSSVTLECDPAAVNATLAALNGVVYRGNQDYNGADQLTMVSDDLGATGAGGAKTDTDTVAITVAAVNDAPVVDLDTTTSNGTNGNDYTTATYVYGAAGVPIAIGNVATAITDVDSATIASAVVTLTNAQASDVLAINGALPGGISANIDTGTPGLVTVTLTGVASHSAYASALQQITFSNGNTAAFDATVRDITVTVNDGLAASTPAAHTTIAVTNDAAPVANPDPVSATEAGGLNNAVAGTNPSGNVITATGSAGAVADTDADGPVAALYVSAVDAVTAGGTVAGTVGTAMSGKYGSLTVNSDGSYGYSLDNSNAAVQALVPSGATLQDVFHYTIKDAAGAASSPAAITITISGADDFAKAFADTGSMSEDAPATKFAVEANDTLDPDSTAHNTIALGSKTAVGNGGASVIGITGTDVTVITTDPSPDATGNTQIQLTLGAAFQKLAAGETATITVPYTLTGDDLQSSGPVNLVVTVNGVNDVPVAVNDGGGASYTMTEDAAATSFVVLANDTKDIDHTATNNITTGTVTASTSGSALASIDGSDVGVAVTGAVGSQQIQLTLGSDFQKLAAGETATIDVSYTLHGDAGDASTATMEVSVTGVNDAPVIDLLNTAGVQSTGTTATFTENGPIGGPSVPVSFLPQLTLTDIDGGVAAGATVHLNNIGAGDVLTVNGGQTSGTLSALGNIGFTVSGSDITFTGSTTLANYQSALQLVEFNNTSQSPDTTARTFAVSVDDGQGANNVGTATATVNVVSVNDAPVNTVPGAQNSVVTETDYAFTGPLTLSVADVDAGSGTIHTTLSASHGNVTVTLGGATVFSGTNGTHTVGLSGTLAQINTALGTLKYHSDVGYTDSDTLTVLTNDQGNTPTPALSDTDTVALTVIPKIWYIDDSVGAVNDATHFTTIAAFNTANAAALATDAPTIVYMRTGDNGIYDSADGVNLKNGQTLLGQGVDLTYSKTLGGTATLENGSAGQTPTIHLTAAGQGVTLAQNNTLKGFNIDTGTDGNAIGIEDDNLGGGTTSAGTVGTLTVAQVGISGAGKAIDIDQGGTLAVSLSSIVSTGSNTEGIQLGGVSGSTIGGSFTVTGTTSITNADTTAIQVSNTAASASFNFGTSTTVNDTNVGNGHNGNGIDLTTNIGNTNSFSFGNLAVTTDGGFGLAASGPAAANNMTVNISGSSNTINASGGAALDLTNVSLGAGATFSTVTSNGGANGINVVNPIGTGANGNLTITGGTLSGHTVNEINLNGGTRDFTYAGTINDGTGNSVTVANKTGGTTTISGAINDGADDNGGIGISGNSGGIINFTNATQTLNTNIGDAVSLASNTGATINFTGGGLHISTGNGSGFIASGGGTVNVTGTGNTISSTGSGTALSIVNTTIGGNNLTFQSISAGNNTAAADPVNGIVLNNTGTSGHLTITGDNGSTNNSSGGTIQHTTGAGILLTSTKDVSLDQMNIQSTGGSGIDGTGVTNFTLTNSTINNSGDGVGGSDATLESNIGFNHSASGNGLGNNISGALTITGNTLTNAWYSGVDLEGSAGTITTANISSNVITSPSNIAVTKGSGILVNATGDAVGAMSIDAATINNNNVTGFPSGSGIFISGGNSNASGVAGHLGLFNDNTKVIEIANNQVQGFSQANEMASFGIAAVLSGGNSGSRAQGNFNIHNNGTVANPIKNMLGQAIQVGNNGYSDLRIHTDNNVLAPHNTNASQGIGGGNGVAGAGNAWTPHLIWSIDGNTISDTDGSGILAVARQTSGTMDLEVINNTVATPTSSTSVARRTVEIEAGNALSAADTIHLSISGNTVGAGLNGAAAIGVRKDVTGGNTNNGFFIFDSPSDPNVLANSPTNAQVRAFLEALNPGAVHSGLGVDVLQGPGYQRETTHVSPLLAAAGGISGSSPGETHLAQSQLDTVVAAAISQWALAGASANQLAALHATNYVVGDLSGAIVGEQSTGQIVIDVDAAGHGWFVDPTPNDNSEFTHAQNASGTDLLTDSSNAAAGHLDLLTAVAHEMGHVLGLDDSTSPSDVHDLMYINLVDGERRLPDATDVAQANAATSAQAAEDAVPVTAQAAAGTPIVVGTAGNDTIDAGHGGNILFGGAGADHFVFGSATPLDAPTPAQLTHVADYHGAEGDSFDFSAITSQFHNSSVSDSLVVRAVEDSSGKFATLQVDHIDPMGLPSAPNWVNVAQLDGAHAGDSVNVLIDNHSVHVAQIHVDLLV